MENRYNALGKKAVAVREKFKEIPFKVISNGAISYESSSHKAIQKTDKILLPIRCLSSIDSGITLAYKDNKVYLTIQGQQLELDRKNNEAKISLEDQKIVILHYEINNGITQIDLNDLKEVLPITYDIQDNELIIKINKMVDIIVEGNKVDVEKGKEILMKDNKIWLPITYIHLFTKSFRYEYKDKQIYMDLDEHTYVLNNQAGNVDLILEDGMTVKLDYQIENGVTRIEFGGLAEYMKLNYTIQDTTLFIHTDITNDRSDA